MKKLLVALILVVGYPGANNTLTSQSSAPDYDFVTDTAESLSAEAEAMEIRFADVPKELPLLKAPGFELTDAYGDPVRLSDFAGRVVALQFWARWCSSCEGDLRLFQTIHKKYANRGVTVLGLGHASGSRGEIETFAESLGVTFPMLLCTDEVRSAYKVAVFPTIVLIDGQGRIRHRRTGALVLEYWEKVISELLNEQ